MADWSFDQPYEGKDYEGFGITAGAEIGWDFTTGSIAEVPGQYHIAMEHQCDDWTIASGSKEFVIAAAERFRDELNQKIETLRYMG